MARPERISSTRWLGLRVHFAQGSSSSCSSLAGADTICSDWAGGVATVGEMGVGVEVSSSVVVSTCSG
jgi:hypothetical protein